MLIIKKKFVFTRERFDSIVLTKCASLAFLLCCNIAEGTCHLSDTLPGDYCPPFRYMEIGEYAIVILKKTRWSFLKKKKKSKEIFLKRLNIPQNSEIFYMYSKVKQNKAMMDV